FMPRCSFATIINSQQDKPIATPLPFVFTRKNNELLLISQFAKSNKQWKLIDHGVSLVIFAEPHGYVSPSHYESMLSVPTWNYIAVHAYGTGRLISEPDEINQVLEQTIGQFEEAYMLQWNSLPEDFR